MITIEKLVLDNFMCIEHADLDFSRGTNLIVGSNGQGKSAILQAITLCLLEDKRGDTYKDYIQLGKEYCSVSLSAHVKGEPLHMDIKINKNSTTMDRTATYKDRTYNTTKEVSQLLESFDIQYYADIIMSMQGGPDITSLKPGKRAEYLQKLLNFDFSDKLAVVKEQQQELKSKIDYNTNQIAFCTKSIEDRKKEIRNINELTFTQVDIDNLNVAIEGLNHELSNITGQLSERDKLNKEKSSLMATLYTEQQLVTKLNHDIEMIQSSQSMIDVLDGKVTEYNASIETLEKEKQSITRTIESIEAEIQKFEVNMQQLETNLTEARTDNQNKLKLYRNATQTVADKKSDVNHAKKHLDMIKLGTCPECGHTFDATDTSKYTEALDAAESELAVAESSLQTATTDYNESVEKVKSISLELASLKSNADLYKSNVTKIKTLDMPQKDTQIKEFMISMERIKLQIEQYKSKLNDIPQLQLNIQDVNTKIDSLKQEVADIESKLLQTSNLSNDYVSKTNELKAMQQTLNKYNSEVIQNAAIMQNNNNINKSIEQMEKQIAECKATVETYRKQKTTYDEATTILGTLLPDWLIIKTCQMLEKEMNNFIQVVFPSMVVKLFQNKRGVEFFYTTDKDSLASDKKENLLNAKMASGFEKAILSIAFKVSLCSAYGLRFAFMDEIDQAGTEENSESLFKAILANDIFDQLFIISHKPTVREAIHGIAPTLKTYHVEHGKFSVD